MKIRTDIPRPKAKGELMDMVEKLRAGDSVWVATKNECSAIRMTLWRLKKKHGKMQGLLLVGRRVDSSDPDGPGFRLWAVGENGKETHHD